MSVYLYIQMHIHTNDEMSYNCCAPLFLLDLGNVSMDTYKSLYFSCLLEVIYILSSLLLLQSMLQLFLMFIAFPHVLAYL